MRAGATPVRAGDRRARYGGWAVVTGASEGIGRAFAEALAGEGFDLVLVARRADRLDALAAQLAALHGTQARVVALDLADRAACEELLEATRALEVGLLVAAAGFGTSGPLVTGDRTVEAQMVDLNCRASLLLAAGYGARMAARGRGAIVLLSSLLAFQGVPRAANYAATKAYVQVLAEGLHRELGPQGVDVLAAAPGPVHTGFGARANMRMTLALPAATVVRASLRALGRRSTVRPGWLSVLLELSLAPLPRSMRTLILAQVMRGMTAHHPA